MPSFPFVTFSGGEAGNETMARVTLEGYSSLAETMENWLSTPSGMMQFRPGFQFLVRPTLTDERCHIIPFIYSNAQAYLCAFTPNAVRIVQNGGVVTRSAVSSTVTDPAFSLSTVWTDISASGGSVTFGASGLQMVSNGTAIAGARQQIATASGGSLHALRIIVTRGPVRFALGTSSGGREILAETLLETGTHSIAFTPPGTSFWIDVWSTTYAERRVASIDIEAAGDLVLPTPWGESVMTTLEYEQSGNVLWLASGVGARQRIVRRSSSSWSIETVPMTDGPFLDPNTDEAVTLTPSVLNGNGTLTASRAIFKTGHVGALFELTHSGQRQDRSANGTQQWSDPIKVQGAGTTARTVSYDITGTWSATVVVQRSIGNTTAWTDYQSFTANATSTFSDGLDNQTVYYRIGIGDAYSSGTATLTLSYAGGSSSGVVRVTGYTSTTVVDMEVVDPLAGTTATNEWAEGAWSDAQSWPSGAALYDGRLYHGYFDRFAGSWSDAYNSFALGDEANTAVLRSVATGRVNPIVSMLPLSRLMALTTGAEVELRASSLDEPITPSNLTVRTISTNGAAAVHPIVVDTHGIYVAASGTKAMALLEGERGYRAKSLHRLHRKIGRPGITQIAASRHPETRLWFVRSDGKLLVNLYDTDTAEAAWNRVVTNGVVESVAVLPRADEDEVYIMVRRTIGGVTRRYLERMGSLYLDDVTQAAQMDSWVRYTGAAATTLTALAPHLAGETVTVWAGGAKHPNVAVAADGTVTLTEAATPVAVGIPYTGSWKSAKLSFGAQGGTALTMKGRPTHYSLLLADSHPMLEVGPNFTAMDAIKDRAYEVQFDQTFGLVTLTTEPTAMRGPNTHDPRLCLRAQSPFWVQVQGIVLTNSLNER